MRRKLVALSIGTLGLAIGIAGCSTNTGGTPNTGPSVQQQTGVIDNNPADSMGPAKPVPGAKAGGNVTMLLNADFGVTLDPAQNYTNINQLLMTLVTRSLATYKETADASGKVTMTVVGDLATNPGVDVNKDCKTWKYTLKDGLKFEDGTAVKAADVAYGIARSFSPDLSNGPHYIQNWLTNNPSTSADYNKTYKGPYNGGEQVPPNMKVLDDKNLEFDFQSPQCDMPFAAALPMTAAVPAAKDTKAAYTKHPSSTGPYMFGTYTTDTSLTLVRNPNWDAKLDATHNAYPDTLKFVLNGDSAAISSRLIADQGDDQAALTWINVDPSVANQVTGPVVSRVIDGATQFEDYLNINTQRVTDVNIRKAINVGIDRDAVLKSIGGDLAGTIYGTLSAPTTAGWKDYDIFGVPKTGDPNKAKAMLGGKSPALTVCYANTPRRTKMAVAVQNSLNAAGFKITIKPVDAANYYPILGKKNNTCDMYRAGWGSDWPSGSTIIPPLFDGRSIQAEGNQNLSYLNDPAVNAEIDRINSQDKDPAVAAADWMKLDQKIMTDDAPVVPLFDDRNYTLIGSKIGGAFLSSAFGATSLNTLFVKS